MEVTNTISELDGQPSPSQKGPVRVFHEVVWHIRPPLKETNQQTRLQPAWPTRSTNFHSGTACLKLSPATYFIPYMQRSHLHFQN